MSDLLEQATRALRETSAEPQPRSGLTRARLLTSAEKRYAARRVAPLRWVVMVAAVLAASTALARVAQYWPEIKRALAPESVQPAEAAKPRVNRSRPAAKPAPLPAAAVEAPVIEQVAEPSVEKPIPAEATVAVAPPPRVVARKARPRVPVVTPAPALETAPAPVVDVAPQPVATPAPAAEAADLVLFRRAQRLHLARDPGALAAWDDYLRVSGSGALVPEARYNRALCLIRLGRKAEAKSALAAFAAGAYGSYRKSEAQALVAALDATP